MYTALANVHETTNGSKLRIKVPTDIVDNISYSFARARMLNPELAKRTESFFVEMTKHSAGGNDQVQRGAMLTGGSKNDHAAVARSNILTVAYVATTQTLPHHRINYDYRASDTTTHPAPPPEQPDTVTSKPSSRSRYSTHAREEDAHSKTWTSSKRSRR